MPICFNFNLQIHFFQIPEFEANFFYYTWDQTTSLNNLKPYNFALLPSAKASTEMHAVNICLVFFLKFTKLFKWQRISIYKEYPPPKYI